MLTNEQIEMRKSGIGASEIAQVAGCSPYGDASTLWLVKTGRMAPDEPGAAATAGSWLEDGVASWAATKRGWSLQRVNRTLRHRKHSWMLATPDRFLLDGKRRKAQVEIKTTESLDTHEGWGEEGTDQIPKFYRCQVQQQMTVTGEEVTYVVLFTFRDRQLRFYEVPHSQVLADVLIELGSDFWHHNVLADEPPEVNPSSAFATSYLARYHKQLVADVAQAPLSADAWAHDLQRAKLDLKDAEARVATAENVLKMLVGERRGIEGPWGRFLWSECSGKVSDSKLIEHLMDELKLDKDQRTALIERFRGESYRRTTFTYRD